MRILIARSHAYARRERYLRDLTKLLGVSLGGTRLHSVLNIIERKLREGTPGEPGELSPQGQPDCHRFFR